MFATLHFVSQQPVSGSPSVVTSWVELLTIITLVAFLATAFKHFNCHVNAPHFCWRFGHPVVGTSFRACHKHHPKREKKVTAEDIKRHHEESCA